MQDDSTIIEGSVKFRDGRKWKSRWCVMRKLSPVADCVHVQLYRDGRARAGDAAGGGGCKASLSLQQYLGCEAGFTLDKHSNTLALLCTDLVAILAFETRERLLQWQVKVSAHLGEARNYLVLVSAGGVAAGPARLHLHARRLALTAGVPPRLRGVWDLAHLRRYGVVEGRFCFEGGSHCGKGEGLHVLITDQAEEISRDLELASQGRLSPRRRPVRAKKIDGSESPKSQAAYRPDARLLELNTIDQSLPSLEFGSYEEGRGGDAGAASPCWVAYRDLGHADTASVHEGDAGGGGGVALERCMSCMSKLGAMSRSSTAALTPGARHFSPAWTMDSLAEACAERDPAPPARPPAPPALAPDLAPGRPPKPTRLDLNSSRKAPLALPNPVCDCSCASEDNRSRVGPYENYDVPKLSSMEIDGEYYDTPKRLKECLNEELFKMTRSSTADAVILKKPCGCLLRVGRRRAEPTVVPTDEVQPAPCACRRVTDWANSWIRLPYCRSTTISSDNLVRDKENVGPDAHTALYATVDLSRKTRRKTQPIERDELGRLEPCAARADEGPLADYENLNFALSLEYYENAKDLLRRAGLTRAELHAVGADLAARGGERCGRCGHPPADTGFGDDYLMMEPKSLDGGKLQLSRAPAGYTPMSPIGGFAFETAARSPGAPGGALGEKSASNPTLCGEGVAGSATGEGERRKRSSSADSSRFLDDVQESEGSLGSRASCCSIETLRNPPQAAAARCRCRADEKHSDADSSEGGCGARGAGAGGSRGEVGAGAGNRDSSSSNDSGVSSCSLRRELPPTTAAARRHYRTARRAAAAPRAAAPRRSRSTDAPAPAPRLPAPHKSSSAEAEVPVLCAPLRGVVDAHSTSSGTSDMSDYIETLSICSSHSSSDTPVTMRVVRAVTTSTLRPRSGKEYGRLPAPPRRAPLPPAPLLARGAE